MPGPWAMAAGVAAATSGWVFFKLAVDWMPGLISIAWVPWIWWAWVGVQRRARMRDCLGIAVFSYLAVAGGWPSTWSVVGTLVGGLLVESLVQRDRAEPFRTWASTLLPRALSVLAGVVSAGLTVLPLYHAHAFTTRQPCTSNDNFLTANLADVLSFAAPQLHGALLTLGSGRFAARPIYVVAWFGVVVLWSLRWERSLWRRPGLVASIAGCISMLLLTQAPSTLGPVRDQIRQLSGVQVFFVAAVCALASAGPWAVSRARTVGILGTLAVMTWLMWARNPDVVSGMAWIVLVTAAALALVAAARRDLRSNVVPAVTAAFGTLVVTLVAFGFYNDQLHPSHVQAPDRLTAGRFDLGAADWTIYSAHRPQRPVVWDIWQGDGVGRGFSDLTARARIAPGYSSTMQLAFRSQACITSSHGQACGSTVKNLFATELLTQVPYVDLLGYRTMVVQKGHLQTSFDQVSTPDWHLVSRGVGMVEYRRSGPISVAGRVTHAIGQADVHAIALSNASQTYHVRSATGARLVFRDLYWPGYVATLDGRRIPLRPLHKMLVSVDLPAGTNGTLTVSWVPLSIKALVVLTSTSIVLLGAATLWVMARQRRARRPAVAQET